MAVAYSAFVRLLVLCGPALGQLGALGNGQAEQVDETGGIRLVVIVILTEGRGLLIVQGVRAGDTGVDHVALVELQLDVAGDGFLQVVGEGADGLTQRGEPLAVVDQLAHLLGQLCLEVHGLLVQRDGFQNIVRLVQDGTAGGLIDAAALHADETVLDDVQQADAVGAAQLVQVLDQLDALHLLAVHSGGDALLKVDGDVGRGVGGLLGGNAQLQEARLIVLRLQGRLLEVEASWLRCHRFLSLE